MQADGKILVGGYFTTLGGQPRNNFGRLNPDGTLDPTFNPGVVGHVDDEDEDPYVSSLALQADGKILVGGGFTTLGGQTRNSIGRLNPDGTLDPTFNPGANYDVSSLAVQADGKILVGGYFSALSGQGRLGIGRLDNTGPATQLLSHDGSTITWLRGGTSPEVWRTTFEYSADGLNWTFLGAGIRIPGGWELAGLSIPPGTILRARGYVAGGDNSSGWFAETMWMAPPVLIGLDRVNDGVDITVSSVAGRYYTLQTTTTLDAWVDVPGAVAVAGTGAALVLHHPSPGARRNFYRVVVRWSP